MYIFTMQNKRGRGSRGILAFTIAQAARIVNVSRSTLRLWESLGLTNPARTRAGYRTYSEQQIERLKYIRRLRLDENLNVAAIRQLIHQDSGGRKATARKTAANDSIGAKLRRLREKRRLTIGEAAEANGLSGGQLKAIESGRSNVSVATLQKLSLFYETNVLAFFGDSGQPRKLVRSGDRQQISNEPGIHIELLSAGSRLMEPHLFRLAPGVTSGGAYHHEGEEFVFVLKGCCEFWLDKGERYSLQKGDSFYFNSSQPHRWKNSGVEETVLVWINTPPTF